MENFVGAIHHIILSEFLANEDADELTVETPLITGGILDSISTLKLVTMLESHFGITIEAHEAGIEHLDSIARIANLVAKKQRAARLDAVANEIDAEKRQYSGDGSTESSWAFDSQG